MLAGRNDRMDALRDLDTLRGFFGGVTFLFDAPWVPVYLAVIYLLHPVLGHIAVGAAVMLFALALANSTLTAKPLSLPETRPPRHADGGRGAPECRGGRSDGPDARYRPPLGTGPVGHDRASGVGRRPGALLVDATKFLRQMVQIAILALGAWLVVRHEFTGGAMIAGSIILGRALQPVEQAIGGWKQVSNARAAGNGSTTSSIGQSGVLPDCRCPPAGHLVVENLSSAFPRPEACAERHQLRCPSGRGLAVIGPSAAGKSTLVRMLVGLHPPIRHRPARRRGDLNLAP